MTFFSNISKEREVLKNIAKAFFFASQILIGLSLYGAKLVDYEIVLKQPDGTTFGCLLTGDEDFSYYHDDFDVIVQHPVYKYYVFAKISGNDLITTDQIAGIILRYNELDAPINKREKKFSGYVFKDWTKPYNNIDVESGKTLTQRSILQKSKTPKIGKVNNIVIFIRFPDQKRKNTLLSRLLYKQTYGFYKSAYSYLNTYYKECSYGKLDVQSRFFGPDGELLKESLIIDTSNYFEYYDIKDSFINKLKENSENHITKYIYKKMNPSIRKKIKQAADVTFEIREELNRIVISNYKFYSDNKKYFDTIITSTEILDLLAKKYKSESDMEKLNRLLISEVFPEDFQKSDLMYIYDTSYTFEDFSAMSKGTGNDRFKAYLSYYTLLASAVEAVSEKINLSATELDQNNDGYVDHITFIFLGEPKSGDSMPFSHMGTFDRKIMAQIYDTQEKSFHIKKSYYNTMGDYITEPEGYYPKLKGLELGTYNVLIHRHFVEENSPYGQLSVANHTAVHEFFHSIGAPDLYRLNHKVCGIYNSKFYHVVGFWDIMSGFPSEKPEAQMQMNAYMKWKYGKQYNFSTEQYDSWIADSQWSEINPKNNANSNGNNKTYILSPLASQVCKEGTKYFYKIVSDVNNNGEYFIVEYRKKIDKILSDSDITNDTDISKGNAGLLFYRINEGRKGREMTSDDSSKKFIDGNKYGPPYEVYLFRNYNKSNIYTESNASLPNSFSELSSAYWERFSYQFNEISGYSVINAEDMRFDTFIKSKRYIFFTPFINNQYFEENVDYDHFLKKEILGSGFKIYDILLNNDNTVSFKVEYEKK